MATIVIENLSGKTLSTTRHGDTVLAVLQAHDVDWMHSCGARGRCTTCKFRIVQGEHQLSELSPSERAYRDRNQLKNTERLACQARLNGDIVVAVPEETKLTHISYSD